MPQDYVPWIRTGKEMPPVFHGGKAKIREIILDKVQGRDYGFYGRGFYVTTSPSYAKTYGPKITEFRFVPSAVILVSRLKPQDVPPEFVNEVVEHLYRRDIEKAIARGKEAQFVEGLEAIRTEPLEWKNAVDSVGLDLKVDAVMHSPGEIVVKNPAALQAVD